MATDQQRQDGMTISATVLTALSTIAVLLRVLVRGIFIRRMGWDDYMIIVALTFTIGYLICIYVLRANHAGFPMTTLTLENMLNCMKTTLAIEVLYYVSVTSVKISILCMYLRFAVSDFFRKATKFTIGFHVMFFVVCIAGTLAQCQPLHKMWDLTGTVEGSCINTTAFFYFTSGFNILTDFWIIGLPVATLIHINRPTREKIALVAVFCVGLFAAIMAIVRLHSIIQYTEAVDPFQESLAINVWSMIEINTGIICASAPALKPLFSPARMKTVTKGSAPTANYPSNNMSGRFRSGYTKSKGQDKDSDDGFDLGVSPGSGAHINASSSVAESQEQIVVR